MARMRAGLIVASFAAVMAVAGCGEKVDLVPANPQAQAQAGGGNPHLYFSRGLPFSVAKIVMPNGEVLPGEVHVNEYGGDNFHAFGNGPQTRLDCVGNMVAGHGTAQCRSQTGAVYQVQL